MFRRFETLVDPYGPHDERDRPPNRLWPFLLEYARPFRGLFAAGGMTSITVAAAEVAMVAYLGRLVNLLEETGPGDFWAAHGWELAAFAAFVLGFRPAIETLNALLLNNAILPNFTALIRWRAHAHVLRQSIGWFESDFAGRIANRIMQTPPAAGEAIFQVFDALSFAAAYFAGAVLLLAGADPRLAIPLFAWAVLYGLLVRWAVRRIGPASKAASDARSLVTGRVVDSYTNIHAVKMFAHHDRELAHARDAIERSRTTFQTEMRIYTQMDIGLTCLNGLLTVAVCGWALWLWSAGAASAGIVVTATAVCIRLSGMSGWIMWAVSTFFRNLGVVSEGMETIAQPIDLVDRPDARAFVPGPGRIEIREVSHHYGRGRGGLDRVSLSVGPGEKVGLVGRSGAGKSTLVKLILRFYDPEGGSILIDGQDILGVTQASLRREIAMVQQDSSLLHRSVRDNILYGRPDASEAEMIVAARRAEAHDFIRDLADTEGRTGYDAHVGERGVKLSGGQRQRIALARAILKDAPILILDEATSALDSEVEGAIQETLYGVMEGKTVIAIAHRLSTIARMDRIVVLDEGRVVEEGSHEALLATGGLYAGFWARQSGGFIGVQEAAE